jgi:site-specific recombinase XerD
MGDPSRVRVSGPLQAFAPGFAAQLRELGYTPNSAAQQVRLLAHVSRWLESEGLGSQDLAAEAVGRFLAVRREAGYGDYLSVRAIGPMLGHLRAIGAAPVAVAQEPASPTEVLLARFGVYLTVERGLVAGTAVDYRHAVRPFLADREASGGLRLEQLTARGVTAFVVAYCPGRARGSAKLTVTALRSLLGFLHLDGEIPFSLVGAVPSVASWRLSGLPRALESEQVARMLSCCDQGTAIGRRDFAILTILIRLGLRSGEAAGLTLEDLDWQAGEIVVRGKGRRSERLPLPADVGGALVAYLRHGRPLSALDRSVFIRVKAPHRGLSSAGLGQVVVAAGRRARLGAVRPHRLRHTAATQMLRAGSPLSEIGQVLRHRSALTTAIYAKVDRDALRELARPWPGGTS